MAATGRIFMKFCIRVFFENLLLKFKFRCNPTRITGTLHEPCSLRHWLPLNKPHLKLTRTHNWWKSWVYSWLTSMYKWHTHIDRQHWYWHVRVECLNTDAMLQLVLVLKLDVISGVQLWFLGTRMWTEKTATGSDNINVDRNWLSSNRNRANIHVIQLGLRFPDGLNTTRRPLLGGVGRGWGFVSGAVPGSGCYRWIFPVWIVVTRHSRRNLAQTHLSHS